MEFKPQDFRANLYNEQRVASYFYRVTQDVAAFKDKEVVNSYHHVEDFKNTDLRKARHEAIEYLTERYLTLPEGFIYPLSFSGTTCGKSRRMHFPRIRIVFYSSNFIPMKSLKNGPSQVKKMRTFAKG